MNRRDMMLAGAAAGLMSAGKALAAEPELKEAMTEAFIYGLPLIEMAQARARIMKLAEHAPGPALNAFHHNRTLSDDKSRAITTPNNDTLYSIAWLDLTQGPVELVIPQTGERYFSAAVMSMYTDNDAVLGTRTIGRDGGRFTIVGPGQPDRGPSAVRVTTPHAWILARTLVDGPQDLAAAHAVQDSLSLKGPAAPLPAEAYATRTSSPLEFLGSVGKLLQSDPPPATDGAFFKRVAALGLTPSGFSPPPGLAAAAGELRAGVAAAIPLLRTSGGGQVVNGWIYPRGDIGFFGQDYIFRAAIAVGAIAALPPVDAMYLTARGDAGRTFTGAGPYRLSFPAGQLPPVDAFWSLTMYEATADGQFFLTANPINRFSIGDRTPGLRKNADGSLDIWIARTDPGGARTANWLPAPASGPFSLILRTYMPRSEMTDGAYRLPPIAAA